ncbi:uncharacterized protein LOC123305460 [Chrysoperla carnea]|uniref:uncharacterized protein LOC123305460 n=1 Tax=Chrysoperla carnea TaxID=189513 RepID=UPI001D08A4E8|nr:uncharacterized protein LOC123305460 [Chrysoperla carnea]
MGYFTFDDSIMRSNPPIAVALYFLSFTCVTCYMFLLINAAIYESYSEAVSETAHRTGLTLSGLAKKLYNKIKYELLKTGKPLTYISKQEIRDVLKIFFFTHPEIDLFFHTHEINEKNTQEAFEICLRLLDMKGYNSEKYRKELIIEPYTNIQDEMKNIEKENSDSLSYHENIHRNEKHRHKNMKGGEFKVKHFRQLVEQLNEVGCLTRDTNERVQNFFVSVQNTRTRLIQDYNKYLRNKYNITNRTCQ